LGFHHFFFGRPAFLAFNILLNGSSNFITKFGTHQPIYFYHPHKIIQWLHFALRQNREAIKIITSDKARFGRGCFYFFTVFAEHALKQTFVSFRVYSWFNKNFFVGAKR